MLLIIFLLCVILDDETQGNSGRCLQKILDGDKSYIRRGSTHRRWTSEERDTVLAAFGETLKKGIMTSGEAMLNVLRPNKCLLGREVSQLRI